MQTPQKRTPNNRSELEELLTACISGKEQAWQRFQSYYGNLLIGAAIDRMHRHGSAKDRELLQRGFEPEDLLQRLYEKLLANDASLLRGFHGEPEQFKGYLLQILRFTLQNERRIAWLRHERRLSSEESFDQFSTEIIVEQRERDENDTTRLREELQQLRVVVESHLPEARDSLELRIRGYSYPQIAELLELPQGTVKSRIHRAIGHYRKWKEASHDLATPGR